MVSRRVWCDFAALPGGVSPGVTITIDDGLILGVDSETDCPPDAQALPGLTTAGFANAHSHAFHRALRGRTHGGEGDFWTWRDQMYSVAARLTPENYLALARAVFGEMLLAGYTVVGEFHYVHHQPSGEMYADPNAMGLAVIEAARQSGIRLTLLDACYLQGGISTPPSTHQMRFSDGTPKRWMLRMQQLLDAVAASDADRGTMTTRIGAAIHSVRAVDATAMALVARFADEHNMALHAHVSEQIDENTQTQETFGCSPTMLLAQQGVLSRNFTAVHATHLGSADVALYSAADCTCCFCPTTERDLADGVGPSRALRDAGVPLSIGSDQHAVIDPFEEIRGIELDERLVSLRRGTHTADDLLAMGTVHGYRSLGWHNGGVIAVGALADLTTVALDGVRLAGSPPGALLDAVVFGATASDVTNVIVAGETMVANGAHVRLDVAANLQSAIDAVHSQVADHEIRS